mgnify:FL=1
MLKKFTSAIECYNKAIELSPSSTIAFCGKGLALYKQKKYEDALEYSEKGLEIEPGNLSLEDLHKKCINKLAVNYGYIK